MAGTLLFTLGSLLCGFAWSETSLIAFRALQGLGAATITPAALSILVWTFKEGRERNIALGAWGAVGGVGAAFGVLFGGILVDFLSWQWIFFVNVPVGVAALVLAPFLLSESMDKHGQGFDALGRSPRHLRARPLRSRRHAGLWLGLDVDADDRCLHRVRRPAPRVRPLGAAC